MELKFLLDSNAVIDFLGAKYPVEGMNLISSAVDDIPTISIISKIEVLSYKAREIVSIAFKLLQRCTCN